MGEFCNRRLMLGFLTWVRGEVDRANLAGEDATRFCSWDSQTGGKPGASINAALETLNKLSPGEASRLRGQLSRACELSLPLTQGLAAARSAAASLAAGQLDEAWLLCKNAQPLRAKLDTIASPQQASVSIWMAGLCEKEVARTLLASLLDRARGELAKARRAPECTGARSAEIIETARPWSPKLVEQFEKACELDGRLGPLLSATEGVELAMRKQDWASVGAQCIMLEGRIGDLENIGSETARQMAERLGSFCREQALGAALQAVLPQLEKAPAEQRATLCKAVADVVDAVGSGPAHKHSSLVSRYRELCKGPIEKSP